MSQAHDVKRKKAVRNSSSSELNHRCLNTKYTTSMLNAAVECVESQLVCFLMLLAMDMNGMTGELLYLSATSIQC